MTPVQQEEFHAHAVQLAKITEGTQWSTLQYLAIAQTMERMAAYASQIEDAIDRPEHWTSQLFPVTVLAAGFSLLLNAAYVVATRELSEPLVAGLVAMVAVMVAAGVAERLLARNQGTK